MNIIALFFPAVIVLKICVNDLDGDIKKIQTQHVFMYMLYTIIVNVFTMGVMTFVVGIDGITISALNSFKFFCGYTIMACITSLFFGFMTKVIYKNIHCGRYKEGKKDNETNE